MKKELQKLFHIRIFPIFLFLCIVITTLLCLRNIHSETKYKKYYKLPYVVLRDVTTAREAQVNKAWESGNDTDFDALVKKSDEIQINKDVLAKMSYAIEYPQAIKDYIQGLKNNTQSFLFKDNIIALKEMYYGISVYEKMTNISMPPSFHGNTEIILSSKIPFISAIVMGILASLFLFVQEKRDGMYVFLKPMPGYKKLYFQKTSAIFMLSFLTFLCCTVSEVFLTTTLLGASDMMQPMQGVVGYRFVPFHINVLTYVLMIFAYRSMVLGAFLCLFVLLVNATESILKIVCGCSLIVILSLLLGKSTQPWLDIVSLATLFDADNIFANAFVLHIGNIMLIRRWVAIFFLIFMICLGLFGGYAFYTHVLPIAKTKKHRNNIHLPSFHFLLAKELSKLFVASQGGIIILLCTMALVLQTHYTKRSMSAIDYIYKNYSMILEGEKTEEKEQFLAEEIIRIEKEQSEDENLTQLHGYSKAETQYHMLSSDQSYIYKDGYLSYFTDSFRFKRYAFLICLLGCSIVFSAASTLNEETDMDRIIISLGKKRKVGFLATCCACIYGMMMAGLVIGFALWKYGSVYEMRHWFAPYALLYLGGIGNLPIVCMVVWEYIRYVLLFFIAWLIAVFVGKKTRKMTLTMVMTTIFGFLFWLLFNIGFTSGF